MLKAVKLVQLRHKPQSREVGCVENFIHVQILSILPTPLLALHNDIVAKCSLKMLQTKHF